MWRRANAFLIDLVPIAVVAWVENAVGIAQHQAVGVLNFVLFIAYFAGMNYQVGGTIGKRAQGLRVALASTPDVPIRLILRAVTKLLFFVPPFSTLYALVAIWRNDGRSLADFVAETTVVDMASLSPPEPPSLFGKLTASVLAVVGPYLLLIALFVFLFADAIVQQL